MRVRVSCRAAPQCSKRQALGQSPSDSGRKPSRWITFPCRLFHWQKAVWAFYLDRPCAGKAISNCQKQAYPRFCLLVLSASWLSSIRRQPEECKAWVHRIAIRNQFRLDRVAWSDQDLPVGLLVYLLAVSWAALHVAQGQKLSRNPHLPRRPTRAGSFLLHA